MNNSTKQELLDQLFGMFNIENQVKNLEFFSKEDISEEQQSLLDKANLEFTTKIVEKVKVLWGNKLSLKDIHSCLEFYKTPAGRHIIQLTDSSMASFYKDLLEGEDFQEYVRVLEDILG